MLTLTSKFGALVASAVMALGLAGAAPAATVSFGALPALSVGNPLATATSGTVIENSANDVINQRLGPWSGIPPVAGVSQIYTSVANGYAEYSFGSTFQKLSFVWGTPDKFNTVRFYLGGVLVDTLAGFGNGNNVLNPTATVTKIGGGAGFDTVRFSSSAVAFEYSNISASVIPVPAAGLMLVTALAGMAVLRRRKAA
jgi:hypothetical protein